KIAFRGAQLETIQALVRAGAGISLIPAMATQSNRRDPPEYRFMQPPKPMRRIVAVWQKQRPPNRAAIEFLKMLSARASG
ncbi:MAG: LysR family transcriptional regulator substrate-binding protein, partial [Limisphaerales bacterium]